jgi:hypothetical protein
MFRPITDPGDRASVDVLKAQIETAVKTLPTGRTSAFDRGSKITLPKRMGEITPGDVHLLARDLGVEVAYVEEGGKRFLYIGQSPTEVRIKPHPDATRILHAQPNNPMPSASDLVGLGNVKNPTASFEIVTETVGESHQLFTVSGQNQADEIMKLTLRKMLDKGINLAD